MKNADDIDEFNRLFKGMQADVKERVISGLRNRDPVEREVSISFLRDMFVPALQHHRNPVTASMAVSALDLLISECRPPRTEAEEFLLDQAIFVYCLEELKERFKEQGGK